MILKVSIQCCVPEGGPENEEAFLWVYRPLPCARLRAFSKMEIQRQPREHHARPVFESSLVVGASASLGNLQQGTLLSGSCYSITWWNRGYPVHSPAVTGLGGVLGGPRSSLLDLVIPQSADQVGWLPNHSWLWGSKDESHRRNKCRGHGATKPKDIPFFLRDDVLLYVTAYLHLWHRYFRETFCNFSALGNWMQGFMHARQVLYHTQLHLSLWTF